MLYHRSSATSPSASKCRRKAPVRRDARAEVMRDALTGTDFRADAIRIIETGLTSRTAPPRVSAWGSWRAWGRAYRWGSPRPIWRYASTGDGRCLRMPHRVGARYRVAPVLGQGRGEGQAPPPPATDTVAPDIPGAEATLADDFNGNPNDLVLAKN